MDQSPKIELAARIEEIRRDVLHMTQAALAAEAGVSQATVSRWESGQLQPTINEMAAIRKLAKVRDPNWTDARFFEAG